MGSDGKDKIQKNKFNGKTAEPPSLRAQRQTLSFSKGDTIFPRIHFCIRGEPPFSIYSITQMETRFVCHSLPTLK